MKTNFLKSIFFVALTAAVFTSCVNDDDYSIPNLECNEPVITDSIKSVESIYNQATAVATLYEGNHAIEGYVVSSDKGGNFYKVIYMNSADGEIGFSVAVNQSDLFIDYGVGRKVYIKLNGLYTQIRNNTLQIGALYNGNVGQIATPEYRKALIRSCDVVQESSLVNELTLADVNDSNLGKLIEFNGVQFADDALGQNYYNSSNVLGGETNHLITDATGATLIFRTGQYAEYSGTPVSSKSGKIRGILTKFGSTYQFVSRYTTDIQLTEGRIGGEPVEPEEPEEPVEPTGSLLFAGGDFEDFAAFVTAVGTQYPLPAYATEGGVGTGMDGSNSLRLNGTPSANGYVFSVPAPANLPTNATKISFYVKGTAAKSLSFNVYRSTTGFDPFNLLDLSTSPVTLETVPTNQYIGTINTNNNWVKVTLNIANLSINTNTASNTFALKVGGSVVYDLYLDNFMIE